MITTDPYPEGRWTPKPARRPRHPSPALQLALQLLDVEELAERRSHRDRHAENWPEPTHATGTSMTRFWLSVA